MGIIPPAGFPAVMSLGDVDTGTRRTQYLTGDPVLDIDRDRIGARTCRRDNAVIAFGGHRIQARHVYRLRQRPAIGRHNRGGQTAEAYPLRHVTGTDIAHQQTLPAVHVDRDTGCRQRRLGAVDTGNDEVVGV